MLFAGGTAFYGIQLLRNIHSHREIALASFFLDDRSTFAFKVLVYVTLTHIAVSTTVVTLLGENHPIYFSSILLQNAGMMYFMWTLSRVTARLNTEQD